VPIVGGPYFRVLTAKVQERGSYGKVQGGPVRIKATPGGEELAHLAVDSDRSFSATWTFCGGQWPWGILHWDVIFSELKPNTYAQFQIQIRNVTQDDAWFTLDVSPRLDDSLREYDQELAPWAGDVKSDIYDARISYFTDGDTSVMASLLICREENKIPRLDELIK